MLRSCNVASGISEGHCNAALAIHATLGPQTRVIHAHAAQLLRFPAHAPRSPGLRHGSANAQHLPVYRWRSHGMPLAAARDQATNNDRSHGCLHKRQTIARNQITAQQGPDPAVQNGVKGAATGAGEPFEVAVMRKLGQGALRWHPASPTLADEQWPVELSGRAHRRSHSGQPSAA